MGSRTVEKDLRAEVAGRFARETRHHRLTVLRDDGLYRHLRCRSRKNSAYWFDLVTWPGTLAIRGDVDTGFMFTRITDMFEFFRGQKTNPDYWAEKTEGGRRSVQSYSPDQLRWYIADALREAYEADLHSRLTACAKEYGFAEIEHIIDVLASDCRRETTLYMRALRKAVREHFFDSGKWWDPAPDIEHEVNAAAALEEFEFRFEGAEPFRFEGWEEWDLRDYDWGFLWACHAVTMGIAAYDRAKSEAKAAEAAADAAKPWWRKRLTVGRLSIYLEPDDLWWGLFKPAHAFYVCFPLPVLVFKWERRGRG